MNELMVLIDANADRLPEGEYLKMCDLMKTIYAQEPSIIHPESIEACHAWIASIDRLIETPNPIHDTLCKSAWYTFARTNGFTDLVWFMRRGMRALDFYRKFQIESRKNRKP